jgi:hypothetical protein
VLVRPSEANTGCSVDELLRMAENGEVLLFAALRKFSAVSQNTLGERHPRSPWRYAHGLDVELLPMYARDIRVFGQAEITHFPADLPDSGDESLWFWRLEEPQTINIENLFIADGHVSNLSAQAAPSGAPESNAAPTFYPRIGWQIALFDAWPAICKLHGGRTPTAAEAIRYLQTNDESGVILPKTDGGSLWCNRQRGGAKEIALKTVQNTISQWRTRGVLPA